MTDDPAGNLPDHLTPEARASLLKIRRRVAEINRLKDEIARSRWQTPIVILLCALAMVWAVIKIVTPFVGG